MKSQKITKNQLNSQTEIIKAKESKNNNKTHKRADKNQ